MSQLVSVIIPLYNQGHFLVDSISSLTKQKHQEWEGIIVNDGSTDHSGDIAESIAKQDSRIKVVHRVNGGLAAARNTGINHASGDYVALLDSDDYLLPSFLGTMLRPFQERADLSLSWCKPQETDACLFPIRPFVSGNKLYSTKLTSQLLSTKPAMRLVWDNPFLTCGQMWKAKTIKSLKYDESFRSNEDWDIACRLERAGGIFQFVEGVYSLYRRHGSSLNNNQYRMIETRIRCGVKNYAHIADPWISGLARLSLVLGSSMLEDNDYLMALIPGDSTDDHSIID
jgi:glycosyltransferase involved in cell wall biosynthesis